MARNGSGTYAKVNTFVAGSTITASGHNQNWDDIASEMTNSVAADGQTTMTGPLKASSGSVSAPGVAFASDTDTGIYRIGSNNLGISVGGSKIIDLVSTACNVVGTVKQNGFALVPVGVIWPYAGSSVPSGWLACNGSNVSRTTYADLFAVLGTTYGSGDGSTTFGLPDTTGRVIAGQEASATRLTSTYFGGDSTALGAVGGSDHNSVLITHTHGVTDPTHSHFEHSEASGAVGSRVVGANGNGSDNILAGNTTSAASTGISINNAGSASAHNICQPTIILKHIIFAGV